MNDLEIKPVDEATSLDAARRLIGEYMRSLEPPREPQAIDAVGTVALREHAPAIAEIKRMYVRPDSRGRAVARSLVERAISEARRRNYDCVRLETLTTMHVAQKLYGSLGFNPIPAYRPFEFGDTLYYELMLRA